MTTNAQRTANRRNAQKSTGPRTPAGKHASSRNRLTHGIRSSDLVVDSDAERPEDFDALRSALHGEFDPATPLEELMVDQIAALHWRARRVLRAEAGAIRVAIDDALTRSVAAPGDQLQQALRNVENMGPGDNIYRATFAATLRQTLHNCSLGQEMLLHVLRSARTTVTAGGRLDPQQRRRLIDFLGPDTELSMLLALPEASAGLLPAKSLIAALDTLIAAAEERRAGLAHREEGARARLTASLALPPAGAADHILRYDTTLGNALARAITQLRHLQAHRAQAASPMTMSK